MITTTASTQQTVDFNPTDPRHIDDPYSAYRRLQHLDPIHRSPVGVWVVTRYADVEALLRDKRLSSDFTKLAGPMMAMRRAQMPFMADQVFPKMVLGLDGTAHMRLRRLMVKAFTPKAVARIMPAIETLVEELVEEAGARPQVDVISQLAVPLPAIVICELLGIPQSDRAQCRELSERIAPLFDMVTTPDRAAAGEDAIREFTEYMRDLVDYRRQHPQDALLDDFIAAEESGDQLTTEEVVVNSSLLFGAGHETTSNLIGNGLYAMLGAPDQLELFRMRPEIRANAIEELLRYDSPVQVSPRVSLEPIEISGRTIPGNVAVALVLGAANRDPARYVHPDELDLLREDIKPLSFGKGAHFCLGAALARVEGRLALGALVERCENIELAERPRYRRQLNLRGLESLRVRT